MAATTSHTQSQSPHHKSANFIFILLFTGLGSEASVVVLFVIFLLPKSRRLTLVGKIYEYRQVRMMYNVPFILIFKFITHSRYLPPVNIGTNVHIFSYNKTF